MGTGQSQRSIDLYPSTLSPTTRGSRDGFGLVSSVVHTILPTKTDHDLSRLHQTGRLLTGTFVEKYNLLKRKGVPGYNTVSGPFGLQALAKASASAI